MHWRSVNFELVKLCVFLSCEAFLRINNIASATVVSDVTKSHLTQVCVHFTGFMFVGSISYLRWRCAVLALTFSDIFHCSSYR